MNPVHDEGLKLAVLSGPVQNSRYFIVFPEERKEDVLRSSACSSLAGILNNVRKYLSKVFMVFSLLTDHKNVCFCEVPRPQSTYNSAVSVEVGPAGRQRPLAGSECTR